jgi:hypothetical protein
MIDIEIVGESFHQAYIGRLHQKYGEAEFPIVLVAEPENPYDPNAVAVYADGGIVGHLSREMAPEWQPMVAASAAEGFIVAGSAAIFGGSPDKPHLGVFGAAPWAGQGAPPTDRWGR